MTPSSRAAESAESAESVETAESAGTVARRPRTQADRSARTRASLLAAAVDCIEAEGFARTTTQRIAHRAGVTVGAVQHHFPSKAEVFAAVLDRSARNLLRCFEGVSCEGASLEDRVALFVDRAWLHYGSPDFRATLEIILGTRDARSSAGVDWAAEPLAASAAHAWGLWQSLFSSIDLAPSRHRRVLSFAFGSLTGMAMMGRLQRESGEMRPQLEQLRVALISVFEAECEASAAAASE